WPPDALLLLRGRHGPGLDFAHGQRLPDAREPWGGPGSDGGRTGGAGRPGHGTAARLALLPRAGRRPQGTQAGSREKPSRAGLAGHHVAGGRFVQDGGILRAGTDARPCLTMWWPEPPRSAIL